MEQTKQQNQNSAPEKQSWQAVEPSVFRPEIPSDNKSVDKSSLLV